MTMKPVSPDATRIGWIGTGVMGLSMCGHLMTKGYADLCPRSQRLIMLHTASISIVRE